MLNYIMQLANVDFRFWILDSSNILDFFIWCNSLNDLIADNCFAKQLLSVIWSSKKDSFILYDLTFAFFVSKK